MKSLTQILPPPARRLVLLSSLVSLTLLSGCAAQSPLQPQCCASPAPLVAASNTLSATGYGSPATYGQYTPGQQKLMAIRAATVDAYRVLAERVYGFRVAGSTSVSAFATQSDTIRSHVDAFIRGARIVNTSTIAEGNVEVTVELDMTPQFLGCFNQGSRCYTQPYSQPYTTNYPYPSSCTTYGCVAPGSNYYGY